MYLEDQAIGVFDSGVGGLSVLRHIHDCLPNERLMYVADSAFMPYGCKAAHVVEQRCMHIAAFFAARKCKALVLACNTATAAAVHRLREKYTFPVIGMEPAIKPAVTRSKSGVVGVLVTTGTANSEKFKQLKQRFAVGVKLIVQPCPGLVEQIEQGNLDSLLMRDMLQSWLQPLLNQRVDTLVLGCTHYPFVVSLMQDIVGEDVMIIDSGAAIACELERQLMHVQMLSQYPLPVGACAIQFWSSAKCQVEPLMSRLWGEDVFVAKF